MNVAWTVLTDGRKHYIEEALPTWIKHFDNVIGKKFIIDDSGDLEYRQWLEQTFPSFKLIPVGATRSGYDAAMKKLFKIVTTYSVDYCLHIEDDFILHKTFILDDLISIMKNHKNVAQVSLMRQSWYHNEHEHGGLVEAIQASNPTAHFNERNDGGIVWTEHQAYWTCNPSIFPSWITKFGWPDGAWSESRFSKQIFKAKKTCGIFGTKQDWPYVEHIGRERYGNKY